MFDPIVVSNEVSERMKCIEKAKVVSRYPVRVAARMTGLKPELIRAWETRYRAVTPARTEGGTRLYSEEDVDRLMLLRAVVDSGYRIGGIAQLSIADLQKLLPESSAESPDPIEQIIAVFQRLDGIEARRLLMQEQARLGSIEFARRLVLPMLYEIGRRWEQGNLSIAVEHLASSTLRSLLVALVDSEDEHRGAPKVVFATLAGEPHDLGTLVASLVVKRAGADLIFLGADVPAEDLVGCVLRSSASALVLGIVTLPPENAERSLREVRRGLPDGIRVLIGGAGIRGLSPINGIDRVDNLGQLEAQLTHLALGGTVGHVEAIDQPEPESK